jgi:hypothetical protein
VISLTFISLFAKNPKTMSQERGTYFRGIKKKPSSHEKKSRIKSQQPRAALVFPKTLDHLLLSNSAIAFLAVVEISNSTRARFLANVDLPPKRKTVNPNPKNRNRYGN